VYVRVVTAWGAVWVQFIGIVGMRTNPVSRVLEFLVYTLENGTSVTSYWVGIDMFADARPAFRFYTRMCREAEEREKNKTDARALNKLGV